MPRFMRFWIFVSSLEAGLPLLLGQTDCCWLVCGFVFVELLSMMSELLTFRFFESLTPVENIEFSYRSLV